MKKFIKKNKWLLFILLCFVILEMVVMSQMEQKYQGYLGQYRDAMHYMAEHPKEYLKALENGYTFGTGPLPRGDAFATFIYTNWDSVLTYMDWIGPLIIIVFSTFSLSRELRSGYIKNVMTRQSYRKYIIRKLKKSWKIAMIMPLFWLFHLFICYLWSGSWQVILKSFNGTFAETIQIPVLLMIVLYFSYIIIHSLFCANLALIFTRKRRDFIISSILSFITYIVVNYFFSTYVWFMVENYLSIHGYPSYNILSNFTIFPQSFLMTGGGYGISFVIILICFLLSFLGVLAIYSNKERVMMESET